MGVLDQVVGMKKQGFSDTDVVNELSRQGISPKEITEALRQAQIKNAVSDSEYAGAGMEPSIMQGEETAIPSPNQNQYQPEEYASQGQEQYAQQEYAPQEEAQQYYQQQQGGYEQYAPSPAAVDTDTIIEIADQLFSEKIKKFQKVLDATSEAAIVLQSKLENVSERLKKIETTMDRLQIAILEKVGSYGQNLESIKKEMSMMSDSFQKMVSPRESKRQALEERYSEEETPESPRKILRKK